MNYNTLVLIIMEWALKNKEYEIVYNLYTYWGIGIPVKYIYTFKQKNNFYSISSFLKDNNNISTSDKHLKKILNSFRNSKYTKLPEWNNSYGYRFQFIPYC